MNDKPRVLDINEAAAYLRVGDEMVRALVREGKLRRVLIGTKKYLFDVKELDRFIDQEQSELSAPKVAPISMGAGRRKAEDGAYKWAEKYGIRR